MKKLFVLSLGALILSSCGSSLRPSSSSNVISSEPASSSAHSSKESESSSTNIPSESSSPSSSNVSSNPSSSETKTSSSTPISSSSTEEEPSYPDASTPITADFLRLFSYSTNVKMSLSFPKASLQFIDEMQSDKDSRYNDIYVPANFSVSLDGGEAIIYEEVGVRMKGNMSRRHIYNDGKIQDPVHFKINFKATFDDAIYDLDELSSFKRTWEDESARKERKNRNLFGLEKLDVKYLPRNENGCFKSEVYCYETFRKGGILAPYSSICDFSFTDGETSYEGYYQFIETIDKAFLKKRFSKNDAKGDLYKCVYNSMGAANLSRSGAISSDTFDGDYLVGNRTANGKIGVEDPYNYYSPCYQLKTNDDNGESSDFSKMANYIAQMWNICYKGAGSDILESTLDTDEFLKFHALSYLLGNFDDDRYNANNYYLYFVPSTGKAIYIPYDYDWSLGYGRDQIVSLTPFSDWTLGGDALPNVFYATLFTGKAQYSLDSYRQTYFNYIKQYQDFALSMERFNKVLPSLDTPMKEYSQAASYFSNKPNAIKNA